MFKRVPWAPPLPSAVGVPSAEMRERETESCTHVIGLGLSEFYPKLEGGAALVLGEVAGAPSVEQRISGRLAAQPQTVVGHLLFAFSLPFFFSWQ